MPGERAHLLGRRGPGDGGIDPGHRLARIDSHPHHYTTESIVEVEQDIDEIQEDIEEMQEDVEEMSEESEGKTLEEIHAGLQKLIQDVEHLQHRPQ